MTRRNGNEIHALTTKRLSLRRCANSEAVFANPSTSLIVDTCAGKFSVFFIAPADSQYQRAVALLGACVPRVSIRRSGEGPKDGGVRYARRPRSSHSASTTVHGDSACWSAATAHCNGGDRQWGARLMPQTGRVRPL